MKWMLLFSLGFGCAASEAELQQDESLRQQIQVSKAEPTGRCRELGGVVGRGFMDYDGAVRNLREHAVDKGANFVRLDTVTGTYMLSGIAFYCSSSQTAAGFANQ